MRNDDSILDNAKGLTEPGPDVWWSILGRGIILPVVMAGYAVSCWAQQSAYLPGRRDGIELYGLSARWMAVAVLGLALFLHARWWWGAKAFEVTHQVLMKIACLMFLSGFFCAVVCGLGGV